MKHKMCKETQCIPLVTAEVVAVVVIADVTGADVPSDVKSDDVVVDNADALVVVTAVITDGVVVVNTHVDAGTEGATVGCVAHVPQQLVAIVKAS